MFVIQRLVVVCNTVGYDDDDYDSLFSFSNDQSNDQRVNVNDVNPENNTGNTARATRKTKESLGLSLVQDHTAMTWFWGKHPRLLAISTMYFVFY